MPILWILCNACEDLFPKQEYLWNRMIAICHFAINIFGDYVVLNSGLSVISKIEERGTLFVLKDKQLADSYRTWFKFMWDACKK